MIPSSIPVIVARAGSPEPRPAITASEVRAAEAATAIGVAVAAHSDADAELLGRLLAGQGGRDMRVEAAD